jgi:amino acid transporter
VWVIPEALITAEMSTAMPEASGAVAWVDNAFGPYWAFQKGWFSWLSGVTDNALYPILFLDCLVDLMNKQCIPAGDDSVCTSVPSIFSVDYAAGYVDSLGIYHTGDAKFRYSVIIAITLLLTYLNYRGLDVVGNLVIVICILSLIPFAIFCIYGAFKVQPLRWLEIPPGGYKDVDWGLLLNTFFWNINFWVSCESCLLSFCCLITFSFECELMFEDDL